MRVLDIEELKVVSGGAGGNAAAQPGGLSVSANGSLKCEVTRIETKDRDGSIRTQDTLTCTTTVSASAELKGVAAPSRPASAPTGGGQQPGSGAPRSRGKKAWILEIDWEYDGAMA